MNTTITLQVRVYPVRFVSADGNDESESTITLTKTQLQAAGMIGLDDKALIRGIYKRNGFVVREIGKPIKRELTAQLYAAHGSVYICGFTPLEDVGAEV